jgi:hypothetical protein
MPANRPGYAREYYGRLRARLISERGGKCQWEKCPETSGLQFAHRRDNGFKGKGRGRQERYKNIRDNPDVYILLCLDHHDEYDRRCGLQWESPIP